MKKFIGVIVILLTLLLTVIYRHLAGSRCKDKPGQGYTLRPGKIRAPGQGEAAALKPGLAYAPATGHRCTLRALREELPLFQLLIQ
ncbi:MAG TPA: hypothetical protein VGN00_07865 [Puia sp.]|jgi:hypothetical protein